MGRNLFDVVDSLGGWNDDVGYGAHNVGRPPFVVVTHAPPASHRPTNLDFTFVTGGVAAAIDQARAICTPDKDVVVLGGGNVIPQALAAGLLDNLTLHISPIVFGGGTPLFDDVARRQLRQSDVRVSPYATHIAYSLAGAPSCASPASSAHRQPLGTSQCTSDTVVHTCTRDWERRPAQRSAQNPPGRVRARRDGINASAKKAAGQGAQRWRMTVGRSRRPIVRSPRSCRPLSNERCRDTVSSSDAGHSTGVSPAGERTIRYGILR
jgi:dihydrofolate reductase